MNANVAVVSYELYVLDSRGWMLHARFTRQQREAAMNEARHLEGFLKTGVKLLRETYFPSTNNCQEEIVYCTPKFVSVADAPPQVAAAAYPGPARKANNYLDEEDAPPQGGRGLTAAQAQRAKKEADNMIGLVAKLLGIMAAAIAAGGFAAAIGGFVLGNLKQVGLYNGSTTSLSFAIFLVVFLLTALPLAATFLRFDFAPKPARKPERRPPPKVENRRPVPTNPEPIQEQKPEEEKPPEEEPAEEQEQQEELAAEDAENGAAQERKADMTRFLGGAVNTLMAARPQLDKSARFAMNLFLAGAVEVLGDRKGMGESDRRDVLLDVLKKFGTKESMAALFADKYDEYLMLPMNMTMVQAGRSAMSKQLDGGGPDSFAELAPALDAYSAPQQLQQAPQQAITTVIFTDMVGSTDLTQQKGDAAAQEVVRRHNTIVRNALREFTGREIKHTGDGIMASFNSASNAVEACIQIQRQVIAHNQKNTDLPMHLRIGMNAGEPIQEENDLFGTTVQLAARVCAKADSDQIFCSNVIKELNSGKAYQFVHKGNYELKGFRDPLPLYEILWR